MLRPAPRIRKQNLLGRALGQSEGKGFRIAHMGHINAPMILGTLSVVEMGLAALGLPHGKGGIQAAVEFLAKSVPVHAAPAEEVRLQPVG